MHYHVLSFIATNTHLCFCFQHFTLLGWIELPFSYCKSLSIKANSNAREGRVMIFNLVEAAQEFLSEIAPLVPAPEPVSYDMELPLVFPIFLINMPYIYYQFISLLPCFHLQSHTFQFLICFSFGSSCVMIIPWINVCLSAFSGLVFS